MRESSAGLLLLGIDPGLRVTGYGLLRYSGSGMKHVGHGAIRTIPGERPARLLQVHRAIAALLEEWQVHEVAVERPFMAVNVSSAFVIGEVRAAAILAAVSAGIPVFEYSPAEVKQAVTSYGRSSKEQIQEMVRLQFALESPPQPADAADALAIAICHASRRSLRSATVASAMGGARPGRRVIAG
jgi:crossover junction endodeoxyribonuclease RuvC